LLGKKGVSVCSAKKGVSVTNLTPNTTPRIEISGRWTGPDASSPDAFRSDFRLPPSIEDGSTNHPAPDHPPPTTLRRF